MTLFCLLHKIQVSYFGLTQFPEPGYIQILNVPLTSHVTLVFDHYAMFLLVNEKNCITLFGHSLCIESYSVQHSLATCPEFLLPLLPDLGGKPLATPKCVGVNAPGETFDQ